MLDSSKLYLCYILDAWQPCPIFPALKKRERNDTSQWPLPCIWKHLSVGVPSHFITLSLFSLMLWPFTIACHGVKMSRCDIRWHQLLWESECFQAMLSETPKIISFNLTNRTSDLWPTPSDSFNIHVQSRYIPPPNGPAIRPLTDTLAEQILYPRLLIREGKKGYSLRHQRNER